MSVLPTAAPEEDPLAAELAALSAPAPANFADQVIARWVEVDGPLGPLYVAFTDRGIASVCPVAWVDGADRFAESFRSRFGRPVRPAARPPAGLAAAVRSGRGTGLDYDLRAVGEFDRAVLAKTLEIPRGEVRPYSWIAREIGRPRAVRAAGSALGRNPVPILIPCHRVVRSDGARSSCCGPSRSTWTRSWPSAGAASTTWPATRRVCTATPAAPTPGGSPPPIGSSWPPRPPPPPVGTGRAGTAARRSA
jgi:O-6-methylguanine DNA methyltransferase